MDDELTTGQAARMLGVDPSTVARLARLHHLGRKHHLARVWLFSRSDVEQMRRRPPRGRPRQAGPEGPREAM